jgi:hypothetical protein
MLPGCCHFHISANSVPYLKPQKRKVESRFWHGKNLISTKRKKGKKEPSKPVCGCASQSRVALLSSGTFIPQLIRRRFFCTANPLSFFSFPALPVPGVPGMLPGCCHFHISANSVPYLKPQKRKVEPYIVYIFLK